MLRRALQSSGPSAVLFLLGVHLQLAAVAAPPREGEDPFGEMVRAVTEAERGLAAGETQIAESRFRTALYEGWMLLGRIGEEAGALDDARRAYETASRSAVDVRAARLALALVLARLDESDEAELVLRTLIEDDAADFEARRLLARTLAEAERLDESVQELEQLRDLTPGDRENEYLLAQAYLEQGRLELADELMAEIAAAIPTPQTHILIGRTYRDADLHERAHRAFEAALALDPEVKRAHYYLGTLYLLDQGAAAFADAAREFELELRVDPDDEMSNLFLGMVLVEDRRFTEAIDPLERASRGLDLRADASSSLGRALIETERVEEGIAVLRAGLEAAEAEMEQAPSDRQSGQLSRIHYQLGQALRSQGDREAAAIHFAEAKRYQASSAEGARETMNRFLASETAKPGLADSPLDERAVARRIDPEQLEGLRERVENSLGRVYLNLGVLEVRENHHRRAAELFADADRMDPELPGLQYSLGVALFNSDQFELATVPLSRALEQGSADGPLQEMLALAWLNAGEHEKAARLLAEIPGRAANPGLQYSYGLALIRGGQAAEAAEIFQQLLRDNANWPELNVVLGKAFAQEGDFPSAADSLRRAIALDPDVAEAHSTLAEIHLRKGELEPAEAELRAELRTHPEDSRAAYTLATVLDLAQKPEEAMRVLRDLLEDQPGLARGRLLLGKILLSRGEAEAALEQLEAAAGLSPDDPNTRYQLGQAYQKLGRRADAQREFEAFRELKEEQRSGEGS